MKQIESEEYKEIQKKRLMKLRLIGQKVCVAFLN